MAEFIQLKLEESITQLETLKQTGMFDDLEIKIIITQRREHEYKLRRRTKSPNDFLSYIDYETALLDLIGLRKDRHKTHSLYLLDSIQNSMARNIERIYREAVKRFPSDQTIWNRFLSFGKARFSLLLEERSKGRQNQRSSDLAAAKASVMAIYTDRLALHGTDRATINLWVEAALWEWTDVGEEIEPIERVRALLKRAIRYHGNDFASITPGEGGTQELWLAYFRIELEYRNRVIRRTSVLTQDSSSPISVSTDQIPTEKISKRADEEPFNDNSHSTDPILTGQMAMIVFRHALKSFLNIGQTPISPDFPWFAIKFFEVAVTHSLPTSFGKPFLDSMVELVNECALHDESNWTIRFWVVLNVYPPNSDLQDTENQINKCLGFMRQAISEIPTQAMVLNILNFVQAKITPPELLKFSKLYPILVTDCCERLLANPINFDSLVWEKVLKLTDSHHSRDAFNASYEKLLDAALNKYPGVPLFWELAMKRAIASNNRDTILTILDRFQTNTSQTAAQTIWPLLLEWSKTSFTAPQNLPENGDDKLSFVALADYILKNATSPTSLIERVKVAYLEYVFQNGGCTKGIELYHKLKDRPVSLQFFRSAIELNSSGYPSERADIYKISKMGRGKRKYGSYDQLKDCHDENMDCIKRVEAIYEDALNVFGAENSELWVDYIKLKSRYPFTTCHFKELLKSRNNIYQKALKSLRPQLLEEFIKLYTLVSIDVQV